MSSTGRIAVIATGLLVSLPELAHACAVCFDARDENRLAFIATTIFLSLFPLAIVAGTLLFLRHRSRQLSEPMPQTDAAS